MCCSEERRGPSARAERVGAVRRAAPPHIRWRPCLTSVPAPAAQLVEGYGRGRHRTGSGLRPDVSGRVLPRDLVVCAGVVHEDVDRSVGQRRGGDGIGALVARQVPDRDVRRPTGGGDRLGDSVRTLRVAAVDDDRRTLGPTACAVGTEPLEDGVLGERCCDLLRLARVDLGPPPVHDAPQDGFLPCGSRAAGPGHRCPRGVHLRRRHHRTRLPRPRTPLAPPRPQLPQGADDTVAARPGRPPRGRAEGLPDVVPGVAAQRGPCGRAEHRGGPHGRSPATSA